MKFNPGWYVSLFGKTTQYPDVMTFDYEGNGSIEGSLTDNGVEVRYQDGGKGTVYGKNRFELPTDEDSMLKLHRAFRSPEGLANRLLRSSVKEAHQLTAGLLTSEEAYAQKRGTYIQWVQDQIENGKYATRLKVVVTTTETGEEEEVEVPVIDYGDDGFPNRMGENPLHKYGIRVATAQITDWSFEKRTLEQIAQKREAQMAIITAKANAQRAQQDAITAEEQGKANVMKAKYEKEVEKTKAVVDAQRKAEVAVIEAQQRVKVAEQEKLEAEQRKLAAAEEKQRQILLGQGEAERKRLVMQADGYMQQKIDAWKEATIAGYQELGQQKWVPEIMMGGAEGGPAGESMAQFMNLLSAKAARDLGLNMDMTSKASR